MVLVLSNNLVVHLKSNLIIILIIITETKNINAAKTQSATVTPNHSLAKKGILYKKLNIITCNYKPAKSPVELLAAEKEVIVLVNISLAALGELGNKIRLDLLEEPIDCKVS